VLNVGKWFTIVVGVIFGYSFYPNLSNWNTTAKNNRACWGLKSSHCSRHWTIACNYRICHGIFLPNTNPRVNGIQSTSVKEILVIGTLGANPTLPIGANPIIAMGVDIIERIQPQTLNNIWGGGGDAIKDGNTRGWQDANKITKVLSMFCELWGS